MARTFLGVMALALALAQSTALAAPVQRPGGHYYEYVSGPVTWSSAKSSAEAKHAHLATIADASENAFVQSLIDDEFAWLGATDDGNDTDTVFEWVTGEPFSYTNWLSGEPDDDFDGNGEALAMRSDGTWVDTNPNFDGLIQGLVMEWTNDAPDLDGDGLYGNEDPDDDNDGAADAADNCPTTANADQADTDGDGQGDACDLDDDGDDVADGSDNCPLNANADQSNFDGDTQGDSCDADDDNDGTPDASDAFPLDASRSQPDAGTTPTTTPAPPAAGEDTVERDGTGPTVTVSSARKSLRSRSLRRSRRLKVRVKVDERAKLVVTASRRKRRVGATTLTADAAVAQAVTVKLAKTESGGAR